MLQLTYSNRVEVLVAPLAAAIARAHRADPLQPITVISPNQAITQFVRFRLAEQLGIAAHIEFVGLHGWLASQVEGADLGIEVLTAPELRLLLYKRLQTPDFIDGADLEPVRRYLSQGATTAERAARALQLAGQLARQFEDYGYARREMLARWRHGPMLAETGFARAERWQRLLWLRLFDDAGSARVQPAARLAPSEPAAPQLSLFATDDGPGATRYMLLADAVIAAIDKGLRLPGPVHVFGLSYVAPAFAEIFVRLADLGPVFVYAQNPCLEFWEDVSAADETLRRAVRADDWAHQGDTLASVDGSESDDPFSLDQAGDTPALRLWGRPGREYVRLLNQLTRCGFAPGFVDPLADGDSLLRRVQHGILVRAPEHDTVPEEHADDSIRFLACPGVRREVEIVADQIWAFVREREAAGDPLRFHQIAVMVVDTQREAYLAHVAAVFKERHNLPFNVIDRPLSAQSRVLEAIDRLLDLPTGDFEYADVMRLLAHPIIGGADPRVDVARWRRWCDALNIKFGADMDDLAHTYIDRDVFNWDQALRRLALGAFVTGERSGDEAPIDLPAGAWLPHETDPGALDDVGRLVQLARCLIGDAKAMRMAELSLYDWTVLTNRLITRYLRCDANADETAVARCLQALETLGKADLEEAPIPFETARTLIREALGSLEGGRGQHQADGVVVSALLPQRPVPYEAIFVLGLSEGQFPAPARRHPMDLRQWRRMPGDVSPAERDRYVFLEVLLAARWRLVLSYVARNPSTGDVVEPSAVVRELQFVLRSHLSTPALAGLTELHPVSSYDLGYFPDLVPPEPVPNGLAPTQFAPDLAGPERTPGILFEAALGDPSDASLLASASREARRGAQAKALRSDLTRHLAVPPPERPQVLSGLADQTLSALGPLLRLPRAPARPAGPIETLSLPLYAVQRFLESPLQGAARFVLGLRGDANAPLEAEPDEPLLLNRQTRYALLRTAFFAGGDAEALYREGYERLMLKGEAPVGLFAEIRQQEDLMTLAGWQGNLDRAQLEPLADWQVHRVGPTGRGAVDVILPAIELEIPLPDGRMLPVHLHGRLLPVTPGKDASLRCIPGTKISEKHFLPGFITTAALSAAGAPMPAVMRSVIAPADAASEGQMCRRFAVPPPELCRDWFTRVLTDLLVQVHDYRLPIETVLEWKKNLKFRPRARPFLRRQNASVYGPVPDPERFELPPPQTAYDMVDRRLALWFEAENYA